MDNQEKIEMLLNKKRFELASIRSSISNWNMTKVYLSINVYYIRFWKNKQRMRDIEWCDKEIAKLEKEWEVLQEQINKEIKDLENSIQYSWQVPHLNISQKQQ